jgi:hypothetical protein
MEERVTKWLDFGNQYGVAQYRVWKRYENGAWLQRHEYLLMNGKIESVEWKPSAEGWINDTE